MAEQYQLPPQFQAPSMAEVSYRSGDTQAADNANFALFTDQINKYTNIQNANRDMSLRERDFANRVVQNDRDYDLRREKQDQDIRIGDLSFELRKFQYDTERKNFAQLEETWAKKDEILGALEAFSPSGGNDARYPQARQRVFKMFADNPNSYKVVQGLLDGYDKQYDVFKAKKYTDDAIEVQGAFDDGILDGVYIGDTRAVDYWRNAKLNQNDDPDSYDAAVRQLRREINEIRTAEAEGRFAAQSQAEGGTIKRTIKLPDGTTLESAVPRTYGTTRAGASATSGGVKTFEKADIEFLDNQIKSVENEITTKEGELEAAESQVAKAGIQAEVDGLKAKKQSLQKTMDMGVQLLQQKATSQLPQATGQPQATPRRATPQKILKAPSFPVPAGTPRQPVATPSNPLSSSASVRFDKAAQASGRRVYAAPPPVLAPVASEGIKASVSG